MANTALVNGLYPIDYFSLSGTDEILYPDKTWWSSQQRPAAVDSMGNYLPASQGGIPTFETLEIDLGRDRVVNFINFDILRAPTTIQVQYCPADDRTHWVDVTPVQNQSFDNNVFFDGNNRTTWHNCDFFFTDAKGNLVATRYLRLLFNRRDEKWPLLTSDPFAWPVFVKHLRTGRYIADPSQAHGVLLIHDNATNLTAFQLPAKTTNSTYEVRQQFVYPATAPRGNIMPRITGLGVLVDPTVSTQTVPGGSDITATTQDFEAAWSLYDVTNASTPILLASGTEDTLAVTDSPSWLDIFFPPSAFLTGSMTKTYEFRISSNTPVYFDNVYTTSNNRLSVRSIPGTIGFTNGSANIATSQDTTPVVVAGSWIADAANPNTVYQVQSVNSTTITLTNTYTGTTLPAESGVVVFPFTYWNGSSYTVNAAENLVMRVWADVGESGRDILGNTYRYGLRVQSADGVSDPSSPGWMSSPKPTPDAVEALYFDVRGTAADGITRTLSSISAIKINPRTPGVRMNVYYSRQNLQGAVPEDQAEWDYLLWTPVAHASYTLRRNEVIDLPQQVFAGFIKLEFTSLNPLPYNLPTFPPLPAVLYNRYPTWIETQFQNSDVRNLVQDWFLRNATPVEVDALKSLSDPVQEFQYEQQAFLAALAIGDVSAQSVNSQLVSTAESSVIDPTTASKIEISDSTSYQNSLIVSVDQGSILGATMMLRYSDSIIQQNTLGESSYVPRLLQTTPIVSSPGGRVTESYQTLAQTPMRFNRTCRHEYVQEQAIFNKKAYFVGIQSVELLRADYTVGHDDPLVLDDLYDNTMLIENTWVEDINSSIPNGSTVWVTYTVNGVTVTDEKVTLSGTSPITLSVTGGPAVNVLVYANPGQQGVQYFQVQDYDLSYLTVNGVRQNLIARGANFDRLIVPTEPIAFADAATVIARGLVPSPPIIEAGTVIAVGRVSGADGVTLATYGSGIYGGTGTYADLRSQYTDTGTVVGKGRPSTTSEIFV